MSPGEPEAAGVALPSPAARPVPRWELPILALGVLAPVLPPPAAILTLLTLAALWHAQARPVRERVLLLPCLLIAAAQLAVGGWTARPEVDDRAAWIERAESRYEALWTGLREEASRARGALEATGIPVYRPDADPREQRSAAFEILASLSEAEAEGGERRAIFLLDPDGEAHAWAGAGLLHEPPPEEIPRQGLRFRAALSSVTLLVVEAMEEDRRPWRVMSGISLPTDRLPFTPPGGEAPEAFRWSLSQDPTPGGVVLAPPGLPPMRIAAQSPAWGQGAEGAALTVAGIDPIWRRRAWGWLALGLLLLAVMRGVGQVLSSPGRGGSLAPLGPACAGIVGGGLAAEVAPAALGLALAGLGLAALGLARRGRGLTGWPARAFGAGLALAVAGVAWLGCELLQPHDLAGRLFGGVETVLLRLGLVALTFGALCLALRLETEDAAADAESSWLAGHRPWGLFAVAALFLATLVADLPPLALPALAVAGFAVCGWVAGKRDRGAQRSPSEGRPVPTAPSRTGLVLVVVLAALLSGLSWEVAYRMNLRHRLAEDYLPAMAPPEPAELAAMQADLEAFFSGLDVAALALQPLPSMERRDLAFSLWKLSPLARYNTLSALVIDPLEGYQRLEFSYGLPLDQGEPAVRGSADWQELALPVWDEAGITGQTLLLDGGRPWGTARWWLLPRPGFRLTPPVASTAEAGVTGVLLDLLQGTPGEPRAPQGLPPPALFALYPASGRALLSPWQELPPVPRELAFPTPTQARVETPSGPAWAYSRPGADGYEVLFLPVLNPLESVERVGTFAAAVFLVLAAASLLALLLALPRPAFRELLRRTVRSYSRRLIVVYTVLLLLPLLLLNLVILRTVETRLAKDRQARGEGALMAAQRSVLSSILTQDPGFGIDTSLSPRYLKGLARLVNHDVNAYFGSRELYSSTEELFTAGFLPRRIPGEIYARLALEGYGIASRTNRVVQTPYLELYAPVSLPGESDPRVFLSLPLLAQQEETRSVLGALRRRAVVASTALIALLVAVGGRLARNFTRPLAELVEGTRRIAAGAPSLDLAPTELELAALVEAVDDMARRIAQGRQALLREKALVERMVEHITSGVVSIDRHRRVLMHNRVAAKLLGVRVGEPILPAGPAEGEELAPVAAFLRTAAAEPTASHQETVRLELAEEGEREWTLIWVPLPAPGEPTALLVVEDVTEVFRGQRLTAWAEMARIIAHEIKNPLTPVRLSAEHMRQVWATDPEHFGEIFERCTTNILTQVDELQQIASEFSTYSRIPKSELVLGDLAPVLAVLADAYQASSAVRGVEVVFARPEAPVRACFDERLLSRALRNLVENAVRANAEGGVVELALGRDGEHAVISVRDRGPGVKPEQLSRIFDPYFSTHDTGTGLGLPIARRIAEEHAGDIVARNRPEGGLEVTIRMPLARID